MMERRLRRVVRRLMEQLLGPFEVPPLLLLVLVREFFQSLGDDHQAGELHGLAVPLPIRKVDCPHFERNGLVLLFRVAVVIDRAVRIVIGGGAVCGGIVAHRHRGGAGCA